MTDKDSAMLAEFAGGVYRKHKMYPSWNFGTEKQPRRIHNFQPLHDWNHLKLVVEALVKHEAKSQKRDQNDTWRKVLQMSSERAIYFSTNVVSDFAQTICDAVLDVISKDGICR